MSNIVKAKKASGETTTFSRMAWDNMGKDRNGWTEVVGSSKAAAAGSKETEKEAKYKALVAAADGLKKDGDLANAKAKYMEALSLKDTKGIKSKIAAIDKVLEAGAYDELVSQGNEAFEAEDYQKALELFGEAQEIKEDKAIEAKIATCEEQLDTDEDDLG